MKIQETPLPGVLIVEPRPFADSRGFFMELYHARNFEQGGLPPSFVQDNLSRSKKGVLRGLHFQNPDGQGKLVSVLTGEIFDVAVDIRPNSPTYKKWFGIILSADNKRQLYIPEGFAHGFCALSEDTIVMYKCTGFYNPKTEATLLWDDPDLGIKWPVREPVLSDKDLAGFKLRDFGEGRLPTVA